MQCPIMSVGEFFKGITAETADQSVDKNYVYHPEVNASLHSTEYT